MTFITEIAFLFVANLLKFTKKTLLVFFIYLYHNDSFIEFSGTPIVIHQLNFRHINAIICRL